MRIKLPQFAIDAGYIVKKFLAIDGSKSLNTICLTPYGTHADIWTPLEEETVAGFCPACGSQMQMPQVGLYTCKNEHPLVKMATQAYRPVRSAPRKPMIRPKRRQQTPPMVETQSVKNDTPVSFDSIKDQVADALGDWL
jgi:hypothetical protein